MELFLPIVYLAYMFISLFMLFFFLIIFLRTANTINTCPVPKRHYSVSVLIPAYNEEKSIKECIEAVLKSDYPIEEIIVINDGSKDRTKEIVQEIMSHNKIVKLLDKKNSGKADSLNKGIEMAKGELIAVVDSDGFIQSDAIRKMVGFFNDENVGGVTSNVLVKHRKKFIEKLQAMEYAVISWTRKLLEHIDGIWVTPGALSIYKKDALARIGGFDVKNLTEDIEIAWRLTHFGYKVNMSVPARVLTIVPEKFKVWANQRIRWNIGGLSTLIKYKKDFFKKGLGVFILPFYSLSYFLGLLGFGVFGYLTLRSIYYRYFMVKYSIGAGISPIIMPEIYFTPTILNMFGISLLVLGFYFTIFAFSQMKENDFIKRKNILTLLFYLIVYLTVYPFLLLAAFYNIVAGKKTWGTK